MRVWTLAAWAALVAAAQPVALLESNPRYFAWRGKPALIVSSGEHYGAVLNLDFDGSKYLQALEREGMNYTRLFSGAYVEPPGAFGIENNTLAPPSARFLAPWPRRDGRFDLARFNDDYFQRLRAFVSEASRRGVIVEFTFFTSTYGEAQWKIHPFHPANNHQALTFADWRTLHTLNSGAALAAQEALVRRVVRELSAADNVIYEIQNEPWSDRTVTAGVLNPYLRPPARDRWPNTADLADAASLAWQARVANWIRDEESRLPAKHLVAWNVSNYRHAVPEMPEGTSVLNFHYAFPEAALWNRHLGRPIACDETGFLGPEEEHYRRQAWRFLLAGGAAYNNLDYSFSVGREDGTGAIGKSPGGGGPALRRQLLALRKFLEALPFPRMLADVTTVTRANGLVPAAFSEPGQAYAFYFVGPPPATVTLRLPPGRYRAEWLDTVAARVAASSTVSASSGETVVPVPRLPGEGALRLTRLR